MIVADTNLLIYLYVQGQRTAESEAVLQRDPSWAVPLLWRSEFRNVLIGLVRRDVLSLEAVSAILEERGGSACLDSFCQFISGA